MICEKCGFSHPYAVHGEIDHDCIIFLRGQVDAMKPVVDAAVKLDQTYPKWRDLGLKGIDIQEALGVYYSRVAQKR